MRLVPAGALAALYMLTATSAPAEEIYEMGGMPGALALPETPGKESAPLCAGRKGCKPVERYDAGRDDRGRRITVVRLSFDAAHPLAPEAATGGGCPNIDGDPDGGSEWHLLLNGKPSALLLSLCTGFGASKGADDEEVMVSDNHLTFIRSKEGQGAFVQTWDLQLSPLALQDTDACVYDASDPRAVRRLSVDLATLSTLLLTYRGTAPAGYSGITGCPVAEQRRDGPFEVVASHPLPQPAITGPVAPGDGIGSCGFHLRAEDASLRAVMLDPRTLALDIEDPAAQGEGALRLDLGPDRRLDLPVWGGDPVEGLTVERATGRNERGQPVSRLRLQFAEAPRGLALAYLRAGKLLFRTGAEDTDSPAPVAIATTCAVKDGRLEVAGLPTGLVDLPR